MFFFILIILFLQVLEKNSELECENKYVETLHVITSIPFVFRVLPADVGMVRDPIREF